MAIAIEGMPQPPVVGQVAETPLQAILRTSATFAGALVLVYFVLTAPSHWKRVTYWIAHLDTGNAAEVYVDTKAPAESFAGAIGAALRQPTFSAPPGTTVEADRVTAPQIAADLNLRESHLVIPKIRVNAPIIWESASDEKIMLANLQQGVAHYGFTALPNADTGKVFITGHSSYYWWDSGQYKTVFALLDQLEPGDQAFIQYEGTIYVYELKSEQTVRPSQVDVTDQTEEPTLAVMTCVPVGTSLNRLVSTFSLERAYAADGNAPAIEDKALASPTTSEPTTPSVLPEQLIPSPRDTIQLLPGLR